MKTDFQKQTMKRIHEGKLVAEVAITLHYDGSEWDPTIDVLDIEKLERVRLALRNGDIKTAFKEAKVYEMMPLAGE